MAEQDHSSDCSEEPSLCDEHRIRKLFHVCDSDGDGYIDSHDLLTICQELNLEESLEELMKELGADESGRISYKEFLLRRLALRPEIEAIRTSSHHGNTESLPPEYFHTSSENSLGEHSAGKCCESWEFDSGARDLSPMPNKLQRLVEASGCSLTATNTASLLELANKLHLAALESLRGEIFELTTRLYSVTQERDMLKCQIAQTENTVKQQYEEQLTELHSVIAELSRKVDRQRSLIIREEDDELTESGHSSDSFSKIEDILTSEPPTTPHKYGVNRKEAVEKHVSELQDEHNVQEMTPLDDRQLEMEVERLNSQLDHSQSQICLLQSVLEESKNYCERLYLLVGKYESNVIASSLALSLSDRLIEAYGLLVSCLDGLSASNKKPKEEELHKLVFDLKSEKNLIRSTIVELESATEYISVESQVSQHSQAITSDLEIAVLMQELMAVREVKTDLQAQVYLLEKEKETQQLVVATLRSQQQANLATIQYLQSQLQVLNFEVVSPAPSTSKKRGNSESTLT